MNQLYAQINVKPDTPAEVVAAELTGLLANGLHRYLEAHPELIQKERCPTSGLDVCSVKLIFVRHHIDPAKRGTRICACPPDVHPEDAWIESERNLNCPACCGSGHVDDVIAPVRNMQNALKLGLEFLNDVGEQTFFHGGWPAVERLNEARDAIKAALGIATQGDRE